MRPHIALELPGAHVLFTTRRGGVSSGPYESLNLGVLTGDRREHVEENHERLAAEVGIPRERFQRGRQVHGTRVRVVAGPPDPGEDLVEADGQATAERGVAALVLVADCLPVALAGEHGVAMVHAGWRGLADGVIPNGVAALGSAPLAAAIGPGICGECYEVGDEVRERFPAAAASGHNLDLKVVARAQLEAAGVPEVHDVELCTHCGDPSLFFSHRRDEGVTGRQAGVVWRS